MGRGAARAGGSSARRTEEGCDWLRRVLMLVRIASCGKKSSVAIVAFCSLRRTSDLCASLWYFLECNTILLDDKDLFRAHSSVTHLAFELKSSFIEFDRRVRSLHGVIDT